MPRTLETAEKIAKTKGWKVNPNKEIAQTIIDGLNKNKETKGRYYCPCKVTTGDPSVDKDIICPCQYREADVEEYGSCYCNLYVSRQWNEEKIPHEYVPERRPVEKIFGG